MALNPESKFRCHMMANSQGCDVCFLSNDLSLCCRRAAEYNGYVVRLSDLSIPHDFRKPDRHKTPEYYEPCDDDLPF